MSRMVRCATVRVMNEDLTPMSCLTYPKNQRPQDPCGLVDWQVGRLNASA
jgi:hypothetical protein